MQTGFPSVPTASTVRLVQIGLEAVILAELNSSRGGIIITNTDLCTIYIKYGYGCNDMVYTARLRPGATLDDIYGGVISGCTDGATGYVLVTEKL